jgi:hypothetical protein
MLLPLVSVPRGYKHVSTAAHGDDRFGIELRSQARDAVVDRLGVNVMALSRRELDQFLPAQEHIRMAHKRANKKDFARAQPLRGRILAHHAGRREIHGSPFESDELTLYPAVSLENPKHARRELARINRLRHKIIRSKLETHDALIVVGLGTEDEDRASLAQPAQRVEPAFARHVEVENDEIDRIPGEQDVELGGRGNHKYIMTEIGKVFGMRRYRIDLVVDDHNS